MAEYHGRHAEWRDLERVFTEESRRDLRWFFAQWLEREGAPTLSLSEAVARPVSGATAETFQLETTVVQSNEPFRFPLQLRIQMEGDRTQMLTVPVRSQREMVSVTLPARPIAIDLDPEFMAFRRIARQSLSPVLNHYVTDRRRSVLMAFTDEPGHPSPFRDIVARIESQEQRKPVSERTAITPLNKDGLFPQEGSVLVLGGSESHAGIQSIMAKHCGERAVLNDRGVTVMGVVGRARTRPAGELSQGRSPRQCHHSVVCGLATGCREGGAAALFLRME